MVNPNGVAAWDEARCSQPRRGWGLGAEFTPHNILYPHAEAGAPAPHTGA